MPAHPSRGQPVFEAIKQAVAAQLGMIYMGPASIKTPPYPVIEYDDDGNETFNGPRQEEVVEGVEAIAGGSDAMMKNVKFTAIPGTLNTPTGGPVSGSMPANSGWIK